MFLIEVNEDVSSIKGTIDCQSAGEICQIKTLTFEFSFNFLMFIVELSFVILSSQFHEIFTNLS